MPSRTPLGCIFFTGIDLVPSFLFETIRPNLPRVFVLDGQHLLVDLLHGHLAAEDGRDGQVAAVARVARSHHVLKLRASSVSRFDDIAIIRFIEDRNIGKLFVNKPSS